MLSCLHQILTLPSKCCSRNWGWSDQTTFFIFSNFSEPVQIVASVSCFLLTGVAPGMVICCCSPSVFCVLIQKWKHAHRRCINCNFNVIWNKWCFINKFREEHAQIINTANSSSVITPPIQSARERIPINNQAVLPSLSLVFQRPSTTPTPHLQPVSIPAQGGALGGSILGPGYTPSSDPSPRSGGVPRARE